MKNNIIAILFIIASCNIPKNNSVKSELKDYCGYVEYHQSFALEIPDEYIDSCEKYLKLHPEEEKYWRRTIGKPTK